MRFGMIAAAAAALVCAGQANAAFVFNGTENAGGVTFTNTGSVNLTGLFYEYVGSGALTIAPSSALISPNGEGDVYSGAIGPTSWGPGGFSTITSQSGAMAGVSGLNGLLILPLGYISGSTISSSFSFAGASFASLGINPGDYTYNFGNGANADTVTVRITSGVAAVPEPAAWAMMILGLGIVGYSVRRRRAKIAMA